MGGKEGRGGLFWLNLVESAENRIIIEKISPSILIGGEVVNGNSGADGDYKITFSTCFSDAKKRLTAELPERFQ